MSLSFFITPQGNDALDLLTNPASAKIFLNRKMFGAVGDMIGLSVLIRESINQTMSSAYPKQWAHFKITNAGSNQFGMMISVTTADEVGNYLWYGTLPHYIEALPGYALEFKDKDGEIIYRETVFVKGIAPFKDHMMPLIDEAIAKVMILVK